MNKITTIHKSDALFPMEFIAIGNDCPETIYAMGNTTLLQQGRKIAVIGARKASKRGISAAYNLGKKLAEDGKIVVSGLAFGCDEAAHKGCLVANGKTIAIVGTGLDRVHPRENESLQETILQTGGLIISEQPLGTKANPTTLVARNRLQAALSETVIVAECPLHSGTMHTVRFAQKYGKPIQAIKFQNDNEQSSGNKHIIDSGMGTAI